MLRFCIVMLNNNTFSFTKLIHFQVTGNKCVQWWSFYVPVVPNGQYLSYYTRHKEKTSVDEIQALVLAMVSHFMIIIVFSIFLLTCKTHFSSFLTMQCKNKRLAFLIKNCCKPWNVAFCSQAKPYEEPKFTFCKFSQLNPEIHNKWHSMKWCKLFSTFSATYEIF